METINLRKRHIENLKLYNLSKDVFNTESKIYILSEDKWNKDDEVIKYLYVRKQSTLANKLFTVSMLNDNRDLFDEERFIIPTKLVSVDKEISGFVLPFVKNNTNLGIYLKDLKVDPKDKIKYLKELGEILKRVAMTVEEEKIEFVFNDFHECNFIIDHNNDDKLCAVDLDSGYMKTNYPQASHYLYNNKYIAQIREKYPVNKFGINIPDKNSDLFCYNMIILNTIAHGKVSSLNINDYYMYLNYLSNLGFNENLLAAFRSLYSSGDNTNPSDYLDDIAIDKIPEADLKVFNHRLKKHLIK